MKRPATGQIALAVLGVVAAVVLTLLLQNQRSVQPLRYRLDLDAPGAELRTVTVYVLDADSLMLVPLKREVLAGSTRRDLVLELVAYLAESAPGTRVTLPGGTRLLNYFEDGTGEAVLDLSAEIQQIPGDAGILEERLRLSALVRTLAENLDGVKRVRLLTLGQPMERWGDHLALGQAVEVTL